MLYSIISKNPYEISFLAIDRTKLEKIRLELSRTVNRTDLTGDQLNRIKLDYGIASAVFNFKYDEPSQTLYVTILQTFLATKEQAAKKVCEDLTEFLARPDSTIQSSEPAPPTA